MSFWIYFIFYSFRFAFSYLLTPSSSGCDVNVVYGRSLRGVLQKNMVQRVTNGNLAGKSCKCVPRTGISKINRSIILIKARHQTVPQIENTVCLYVPITRRSTKKSPDTSCGMSQSLGITQDKIWAGFRIEINALGKRSDARRAQKIWIPGSGP